MSYKYLLIGALFISNSTSYPVQTTQQQTTQTSVLSWISYGAGVATAALAAKGIFHLAKSAWYDHEESVIEKTTKDVRTSTADDLRNAIVVASACSNEGQPWNTFKKADKSKTEPLLNHERLAPKLEQTASQKKFRILSPNQCKYLQQRVIQTIKQYQDQPTYCSDRSKSNEQFDKIINIRIPFLFCGLVYSATKIALCISKKTAVNS